MAIEIASFQPGDLLEAARFNELVDVCNALQKITFSPEGCAKAIVSDTNVLIVFDMSKFGDGSGGGGSGTDVIPFDVLPHTGGVRVRYGTINSIVPGGMSLGDSPIFTLTVTGAKFIVLHLSVSFDAETSIWSIDDVEIITSTSVPAATTTDAYCALGSVSSGGAVVSDQRGSMQWERDGDDVSYADTFL